MGERRFVEERRLKDLVKKHFEFIGFSIELYVKDPKRRRSPIPRKKRRSQHVKEVSHEWEQVNKNKPL